MLQHTFNRSNEKNNPRIFAYCRIGYTTINPILRTFEKKTVSKMCLNWGLTEFENETYVQLNLKQK